MKRLDIDEAEEATAARGAGDRGARVASTSSASARRRGRARSMRRAKSWSTSAAAKATAVATRCARSSSTEIVGIDVSPRALEIARDRLHSTSCPSGSASESRCSRGRSRIATRASPASTPRARSRSSSTSSLSARAFERVVFEFAKPATVIVTTPNAEYNAKFEALPAGKIRHRDHRFEWTRAEFESWATHSR